MVRSIVISNKIAPITRSPEKAELLYQYLLLQKQKILLLAPVLCSALLAFVSVFS
jgi:hypothetical protein